MCKKNYVKKLYFVVSALMFEDAFVLEGAYIRNCFFRCKTLTVAQKKFTLHSLPTVLTIQLKRFVITSLTLSLDDFLSHTRLFHEILYLLWMAKIQ